MESVPRPTSMPGVAPPFPPQTATGPSSPPSRPISPYDAMLRRIEMYVDPPRRALKAGIPPLDSFANKLAKLCLYSLDVPISERRKILSFVEFERLRRVVSRTLSVSFKLEAAERLKATEDFNGLVKEVLHTFNIWCRSWNAVPRRDISPTEAAVQLSQQAFSAPKEGDTPWEILVFVFGRAPELWGLGPPDSLHHSGAESSGGLVGDKGKAPEVPHAAPLVQLGEISAVTDDEPMVVDDEGLGLSYFLPAHFGADFLPDSAFEAPTQTMGSGEDVIHNATSAIPIAPISEAQTTDATAGVSAVTQSAPPDDVALLLQHQDLTTFLSAYGILELLPGCELSTLLHDALQYHEEFRAEDYEELNEAMANVLRRLREFRQVHGEVIGKLWRMVRHIRQWHTWGLEVQYLYEKHGITLSPEALSRQRKLFTFLNGYTILILQLIHQQAGFQPPEA